MPTPTARLYYDDPFRLAFDATVIAHATHGGRFALALDRSAFYPEAGGQLGDAGTLGGLAVRDVQVDGEGTVLHVVEVADGLANAPAVGTTVTGTIDRARRRLHMALHTGQHMLSRALLDVARAETVSSRLGTTSCTIDVNLAKLDERDVARAEDLVNAVIEDDRAIRAYFPSANELAALPLRRAPKVTENVRVVDVEGFDVSPCGGTHCTRSAQVGLVSVTGLERYKGGMRVTFLAGRSAVAELGARSRTVADLAKSFTCGTDDVRNGVEKLRRDLTEARETVGDLRARSAEATAREMVSAMERGDGDQTVVCVLEGEPVETLRAIATRVTTVPDAVALLGARTTDGVHVVAARGAASGFDCGAWLKRLASATGGRGGGRSERAEGKIPGMGVREAEAAMRAAVRG